MKEIWTVVDEGTQGMPRKITIVLNWDVELKQRAPVD